MRTLTPSPVDPAFVASLVLLAAVMHASWNALIKGSRDPVGTQALLMFCGVLLAAAAIPWVPLPARESWPLLGVSILVHTVYRVVLVWAYREGDLSKVYPLARGFAPLLVALAAMHFADEWLNRWETAGVLLVSAGIASLAFEKRSARQPSRRPVVLALLTGLLVSSYSLIDGLGARRAGSAIGYAAWLFVFEGLPFAVGTAIVRRRDLRAIVRSSWKSGLIGGVISTLGYTIVIWAMSVGGMAQTIALRETSVIVAALIGVGLMKEGSGARRIAAAATVVAGNLLLQIF